MNWDEFVQKRWSLVKWSLIFGSYTLLAFFSANKSIFISPDVDHGLAYGMSFTDWYAWALLTPFIIWFIHKYTHEYTSLTKKFLLNLPASIGFTLLHLLIVYILFQLNPLIRDKPLLGAIIENNYSYVTCLAIFGVDYAFDYYAKFRERGLKTSQLEAKLAQTQLQVLKMQIHPHFLFNTLNAISTLIRKDPDASDRMLTHLSDLLRITLDNAGEQEVPLEKELELLEPYLEIEKTRFSDRLVIAIDIEPEVKSAKVPNLLLQPLVENAIKHGIGPRSSGGRIEISAKKENGRLLIEIRDDGLGIPGDSQKKLKEGIGISNTRARLKQLYGDNFKFSIHNRRDSGVLVEISIPFAEND